MTGDWVTVTPGNSSPVERERDAMIERAILRDGRPLDALGIVAEQTGTRWKIEVLGRAELLERLDARARLTRGGEGHDLVKEIAAWIRGLPRGVCPQLFRWDEGDGTWSYQRATIQRERRRRAKKVGAR
mgnify:FL=1